MSDRAPRQLASRPDPRAGTDAAATAAVSTDPGGKDPSKSNRMARWNVPRAWQWIAGHWASRFELPVLGQVGRSLGNRLRPRLTTQSVDRWTVDPQGVRILSLSGPAPGLPAAANLAIGFDPSSGRPTLALESTAGPAATLAAIAATGKSITFQGGLAPEESGPILRVTIEQVGKVGLRIVAELGDAPGAAPLFSYSARKLIDGQAA
ncbi:MAG: hypothetical protein U0800_17520 [Isosphaeraceae bacterium]